MSAPCSRWSLDDGSTPVSLYMGLRDGGLRSLATLSMRLLRNPALLGSSSAALHFGWLLVDRGIRFVFGVLVGFLVARFLGPKDYGLLSYALAVVALGSAVAEAGVSSIVKRDIIADPGRSASVLMAATTLRLLAGAVCYASVLIWASLAQSEPEERVLLAILGLLLFQPGLSTSELWLHARLDARISTIAQAAALVLGALTRIALVISASPLWTFAVAAVLESSVAVLLINHLASVRGLPSYSLQLGGAVRRLWRDAWPMLLSGLTVIIYIRIDIVMVRHMSGQVTAGIYSAAVRLSEIWLFLPGAVVASLLPSILKARATDQLHYRDAMARLLELNTGIAYGLAVPTVILAPWLMRIAYGSAYGEGAAVLAVHGWALIFAAIGVVRGQFCVNEGLMRLHLAATAIGAVLNVGANLFLIPRFGGVGAAYATLIAQIVAAWLSSFWFAATRKLGMMQTRALLMPVHFLKHVWNFLRTAP